VSNLNKFLTELKDKVGESGVKGRVGKVTSDQVQKWIDNEAYYNLFLFFTGYYNGNGDKSIVSDDDFATYKSYYAQWTTLHDEVVKYHEAYNKYSCFACTSDQWLNNYSMVVLGFAEDFGGKDLTVKECDMVRNFVNNGGSILATHDSTTRYKSAGSVNLTTQLRSVFGIDRFHASVDTTKSKNVSVSDRILKDVYLKDRTGEYYYGPVYVTNKDVTIKYVKAKKYKDESDPYLTQTFTNGDGTQYWIYKPYEYTYGNTVTSGNIKITVELYDSEEDAKNGILSKDAWGTGFNSGGTTEYFNLCSAQKNYFAQVGNFPFSNNQSRYTLDSSNFSISTKSVSTLKLPYYTFADDKYFITNKSVFASDTEQIEDRIIWQNQLENSVSVGNGGSLFGVINPIGTTDSVAIFETGSHLSSPYKYAEFNLQDSITYSIGVNYSFANRGGTNKASQVNKGIITTYPFQVSDELDISPTHPQTYATDLEDSNMVVWYTLAGSDTDGGLGSRKSRTSLFAASPHDGMDNYFLYSYRYGSGVVHYCGAGHSVVTGAGMNNNDERMLYINIVVDSVRNQGSKPKIKVYEPKDDEDVDAKRTEMTQDSDGTYIYKTDNIADVPEFDFTVKFNSLSTLQDVYVFYDLNYDGANGDYSNKYTDDSNHVLIHHYVNPADGDSVDEEVQVEKSKMLAMMREKKFMTTPSDAEKAAGCTAQDLLSLNSLGVGKDSSGKIIPVSRDYFTNYGNYTYIVIYAIDSNGKTASARIKISLTQTLFDLTQTEFNLNQQYLKATSSKLDICDRSKFNI
jgi:hypothetical protein